MGSARHAILTIMALAMFVSSFWLLAVDSAGRVMSGRWEEGGRVDGAGWLAELVIADPRIALKAGAQCMATAANQQDCRSFFERALAGNRRLTEAEAALILLAEQRNQLADAARMLHRLERRNGSFAVRWLTWNFHLRNGPAARFRSDTEEVLRSAPANFRGDFPLLPLTGLPAEEIVEAMLQAGTSGRALDYAVYLAERDEPGAGELLADLLGRVDRHSAGETALRFIAEQLGSRRRFNQAALVWAEAMRLNLVEDRRASPRDDPVLNPNPGLRKPFVPRSFDWSVAENRWAAMSGSGGDGVRIEVRFGAPEGMPLLSKLLLLPENSTGVRIRMRARYLLNPAKPEEARGMRHFVWQVYDTLSNRVVMRSSQEERPAANGYQFFELPLSGITRSEAVFLTLAVGPEWEATRETGTLEVSEVHFEILP